MKKLVWLFMLGILITGCSKKEKGDDDSGSDQNHEPGYVVLYLNDQKVVEGTASSSVYDTTNETIGVSLYPENSSTGPARLGILIGNYVPPVGGSCGISISPASNEASLMLISDTHDFNDPFGHPFQHAFAFSGQLKRLSQNKFEATGTIKHYYDPNNQTVYAEMNFKVIFILKLIL